MYVTIYDSFLKQASTQNSESDNQKEEKLVMEKKIADLEDKLRVQNFKISKLNIYLTFTDLFQQFNISTLTTDQVSKSIFNFLIEF